MTRFNLATPGRELVIRNQPGWLQHRFDLFERYCLPSVAAQCQSDFRWIIYFDKDTPDAFCQRIEHLQTIFPFTPYFTGLFDASGWPRSLQETCAPKTPLVLTTRLDNDDALAHDFVDRLHSAVNRTGQALGAYNFRNGLVRRGSALFAQHHGSNAFFSLLEPNSSGLRTASSIQHMHLDELATIQQIEGPPAWMQIVHETNVSNKVRGRRVPPNGVADRFVGGAGLDLPALTWGGQMMETLIAYPARKLRDGMIGLLRGLRRAG